MTFRLVLAALFSGLVSHSGQASPPAAYGDFGLTFEYLPTRDGLALLCGGPSQAGYLAAKASGEYWTPRFAWEKRPSGGDNSYNGEFQFYVDPEHKLIQYSPFAIEDAALRIRAERTTEHAIDTKFVSADPATGQPYTWLSGILSSNLSFAQHGGYFEIDAKVPKGNASWPAFWLLPDDEHHPPEIDILEYRGFEPDRYHVAGLLGPNDTNDAYLPAGVDLSLAYHRYAVLWTDTALTFLLDEKPVKTVNITDRQAFGRAFYLLINLAVGSRGLDGFIPAPDSTTPSSLDFLIRSVRVWQRKGPTAIHLSATSVSNAARQGTIIAYLSTETFGTAGVVHYSLIADPDAKFVVRDDRLLTRAVLDFQAKQSHLVSILAMNAHGQTWRQAFEIEVLDTGTARNLYFSDEGWAKEHVSIVKGQADSDGSQSASFLKELSGGRQFSIERSVSGLKPAPTRYLVSGDFKPLGRDWVKIELSSGDYQRNVQAFFNIADGKIGNSFASPALNGKQPFVLNRTPVIIKLRNGFYRCLIDVTAAHAETLRTIWRIVDHDDEQEEGHVPDLSFRNGLGEGGRGVIAGHALTMVDAPK